MEELAKATDFREFLLGLGFLSLLFKRRLGRTLHGSEVSLANSALSALSFTFDPIALPSDTVPLGSVAPPSDFVTLAPAPPPSDSIVSGSISRSDSVPLGSISPPAISVPSNPFGTASDFALLKSVRDDVEEATFQRQKFEAVRVAFRHVLDLGVAASEVCTSVVQ